MVGHYAFEDRIRVLVFSVGVPSQAAASSKLAHHASYSTRDTRSCPPGNFTKRGPLLRARQSFIVERGTLRSSRTSCIESQLGSFISFLLPRGLGEFPGSTVVLGVRFAGTRRIHPYATVSQFFSRGTDGALKGRRHRKPVFTRVQDERATVS